MKPVSPRQASTNIKSDDRLRPYLSFLRSRRDRSFADSLKHLLERMIQDVQNTAFQDRSEFRQLAHLVLQELKRNGFSEEEISDLLKKYDELVFFLETSERIVKHASPSASMDPALFDSLFSSPLPLSEHEPLSDTWSQFFYSGEKKPCHALLEIFDEVQFRMGRYSEPFERDRLIDFAEKLFLLKRLFNDAPESLLLQSYRSIHRLYVLRTLMKP